MSEDTIKIEILPDGTIRIETDAVSPANHVNADKLLSMIAELAGGKKSKVSKGHAHKHQHGGVHHTH